MNRRDVFKSLMALSIALFVPYQDASGKYWRERMRKEFGKSIKDGPLRGVAHQVMEQYISSLTTDDIKILLKVCGAASA